MSRLTNRALFPRPVSGQIRTRGSALLVLVEPTWAEAECLAYDLHQSLDDTDVWFIYENWLSASADRHATAKVRAFIDFIVVRFAPNPPRDNKPSA